MKRKFLACALVVTAAAFAAAFAGCKNEVKTFRQDNICYYLKDDGTYVLERYEFAELPQVEGEEGYTGTGETVIVPDMVNGKAVTSIGYLAFAGTGVKEVTLPDAVSVLSDRVFDGCELLETVNFSTVTKIGEMAFKNCKSLTSIEFESGLTQIGNRAFEGCSALVTVTLPDTVNSIGKNCFSGCAFESINTAGVEVLGDFAFYKCANVTSFDLTNVVTIGENAFNECEKLTEMKIGDKLESCAASLKGLTKASIDSPLTANLFMWAENLTDVTLGEGVTSIGEMAFAYCSELKNLTLPATLTGIGKRAFLESGLTSVNIPASVNKIDEKAFYGCKRLESIIIENGVEIIGESAFERLKITSLSLPASVKTVGNRAFLDCESLTSITFAEGLETIGEYAFAINGAETLEIILPSTVKTIGKGCFSYNSGITANKIVIGDTVETIGKDALFNCKVKELTVPASYDCSASNVETLTLLGEGVVPDLSYCSCKNLKTVNLSAGVKGLGANAFGGVEKINLGGVEWMGMSALGDVSSLVYTSSKNGLNCIDNWVISSDYSNGGATSLDLSGYTGIYDGAFRKTDKNDTSALTEVALVGSDGTSKLKCIGERAFAGSGITAVEVPSSMQVWRGAFWECSLLSDVVIQRGVKSIPEYAFNDCTSLEELNIAATDVVEIGNWAFYGCENLQSITFPDGIKRLGHDAFVGCRALTSIDLKGTEEIGNDAFIYCTSLARVTMGSVKKIGKSAFYACTELTEYDLPASLTEICYSGLGCAQVVNYAGTSEQWAAITKGDKYNVEIWQAEKDLTVNFGDGGSVILRHRRNRLASSLSKISLNNRRQYA